MRGTQKKRAIRSVVLQTSETSDLKTSVDHPGKEQRGGKKGGRDRAVSLNVWVGK